MSISLPDDLMLWANQRVAEGRYSSLDDLVTNLLQRGQEEALLLAPLQEAVDKGLASPPVSGTVAEIIADVKAEYRTKLR